MSDTKDWIKIDDGKCVKMNCIIYMEIKISEANQPLLILKDNAGQIHQITDYTRVAKMIKEMNNPILTEGMTKLFGSRTFH